MTPSKRARGILRLAAAAALGLLPSTFARAQPTASHAGHIDGSSETSFEVSVATILNSLPAHRRDALEVALAAIWMSNSLGPAGLDRNGDGLIDATDSQMLADDTNRLLTDIDRGDLLAAIEKREKNDGNYTVADYVKRLDGLGYDEVLELAGRPGEFKLPSMKRSSAPDPIKMYPKTARALNDAMVALHSGKLADARAALDKMPITHRLTPYERSKIEQILFNISYREGKLAEAHDHLQNALTEGGLDGQEISTVLAQIHFVDAVLAASQSKMLSMPTFP